METKTYNIVGHYHCLLGGNEAKKRGRSVTGRCVNNNCFLNMATPENPGLFLAAHFTFFENIVFYSSNIHWDSSKYSPAAMPAQQPDAGGCFCINCRCGLY